MPLFPPGGDDVWHPMHVVASSCPRSTGGSAAAAAEPAVTLVR
jgi:hypothetical protein